MVTRLQIAVVLLVTLLASTPASANHAFLTLIDDGGVNDEPGQKDLTMLDVDDTHPGMLYVNWNWDEVTGFSGANTGDACVLIDTDGDGLVNYALCVTIEDNTGGIPVQIANSPRLYLCDEFPPSVADRKCTGSVLLGDTSPMDGIVDPGAYQSNCSVVSPSADDPFPGGDDFPYDTKAVCTLSFVDIGADGTLLNVCSYPSQIPNSDPSDCVVIPGSGFIRIVKVATPDEGTQFDFTLDPPANDGTSLYTLFGSGSSELIAVAPVLHSITETVPMGWELDDASCEVQGAPTGVFSDDAVTAIEVLSGVQTICTFYNVIPIVPQPAIDLTKSGVLDLGADGVASAGDLINYTFVVQNIGNVDLTNVMVTDPTVGPVTCPQAALATDLDGEAPFEGESMTCTASYALTQADIEAGVVDNTATATGEDAAGTQVSDTDSESVPVPRAPEIDLTKSGVLDLGPDGVASAGDLINYTFVVQNVGNVDLMNVMVTDPTVGPVSCPQTTLAADADGQTPFEGESMTCTASYVLTQADIEVGVVDNTATATGEDAAGTQVSDMDSESVTVPRAPEIDLTKSGVLDLGANGIANPGDLINYTFVVQNVGNVNLSNVAVTDPTVGPVSCPQTTLAADPDGQAPFEGESMTCTASYALTQADIEAGVVGNTATATGEDVAGTQVSDTDSESVPVPQLPGVDLEKHTNGEDADVAPGPTVSEGSTVTWTYIVTNTGNVTLQNIGVTDDQIGMICTIGELGPGASETCSATGTALPGQYQNLGTATAMFDGVAVADTDPGHYNGGSFNPCVNIRYPDFWFADTNWNRKADRINGNFELYDATAGGQVPSITVTDVPLEIHYKYGSLWRPVSAVCTTSPAAPFSFSGSQVISFQCIGLNPEIPRGTSVRVTFEARIPGATGNLTRTLTKNY